MQNPNFIDDIPSESSLSVLVVDDSRLQRKLVSTHLKKWGFTLHEAASGQEALDILDQHPIDMILSDWVMPEMSGPEFCQEFRKLPRENYGYFILLTSKSEKGDIAEGLEKGADDFLSKPVNAAELRARIKAGERILSMQQELHLEYAKTTAALAEVNRVNAEMTKDLIQAEKLQHSLLPAAEIITETYRLSNIFKSSGHVGGDLLGTFALTEDRIAVYSLDVSGHGVSSALLTVQLNGQFSPHDRANNIAFKSDLKGDYTIREPHEIAAAFNHHLLAHSDTELYFTLAYADINLKTGHTKMVQAGHPFPVIFNHNTGVRRLGEGGPPIGLIPDVPFETFSFDLNHDDKLLLYSDGLTECQNTAGDLLDDEGLETILLNHQNSSGPELLADIVWDLTEFAEGDDFGDDLSAILFEFSG
ncbi:fused response regulator/phosphatase [Amylibacter marinus]|uniref:Fused response regulator/phosphatase n=1 Tax=Amylibacter marinus TaxID=1475483 RepID=A0ABQ5VVR4_9RHOB|nr:SpoIIE family protein phosphatase [Amylibacter marinus]GLQ35377.1 fused response regulator/phosphatase [Amylibacter marinus]